MLRYRRAFTADLAIAELAGIEGPAIRRPLRQSSFAPRSRVQLMTLRQSLCMAVPPVEPPAEGSPDRRLNRA